METEQKDPTARHSPLKRPPHIYEGNCPDKDQPEAFDSECARCQVDRMETSLAERDAEIKRLRNEISRLQGQTLFMCQCGGVREEPQVQP